MSFKPKVSTVGESISSVSRDITGKNQLDKKSGAGVTKKKMTKSNSRNLNLTKTLKKGLGPMSKRQYKIAMAASR